MRLNKRIIIFDHYITFWVKFLLLNCWFNLTCPSLLTYICSYFLSLSLLIFYLIVLVKFLELVNCCPVGLPMFMTTAILTKKSFFK